MNNYHFIVIGIVLLGIGYYFQNIIILLLFGVYLIYLFKNNFQLFLIATIIFALFILGLIIKGVCFENRLMGENSVYMTVIEVKKEKNGYFLLLKYQNLKYRVITEKYYEVGSVLYIKGAFYDLDQNHLPDLFNYFKYGKYNGLAGRIIPQTIQKVDKKIVLTVVQDWCLRYYDQCFNYQTASYLKALVIGDKSGLDIMNSINSLGISHLFVVSGMHVSLLAKMLELLIKKIVKKDSIQNIIILLVLNIYILMTNFLVSVIRVVIGFVINIFNKKYHLKLTPLDILSQETIMLLLINPYYLFQSSFILSFSLTYALVIGNQLLKEKNYFKALIKMTVFCQIVSLPLAYNFSNEFNVMSVPFNLFFVPFVSYVFLPSAIIVSFLPFLGFIYQFLINIFESIVKISLKLSIYINFPKIPILGILLFIVLIIIWFRVLEMKKRSTLLSGVLLIFIVTWMNYAKFDLYDQIIFFDLPNGEATLIHQAFNQSNILIDTGDVTDEDQNSILQYLKKQGINVLDYVIITHSDSDHLGGLEIIMKKVKVKNIITNYYENKELFNKYQQYNSKLNIYYLKKGMNINLRRVSLKIYSPEFSFGDVNNNSLVFSLKFAEMKILFTGDIEEIAENSLILDDEIFDILKIAHHGSKTSTSDGFLKKVKFKEAVIMNGYYNIFDFPHSVVLARIKEHPYYVLSKTKTLVYQKLFFRKQFHKR